MTSTGFIKFLILFFLIINTPVFANSAPISMSDYEQQVNEKPLLYEQKNTEKKNTELLYVQKNEEIKTNNVKTVKQEPLKVQQNEEIKTNNVKSNTIKTIKTEPVRFQKKEVKPQIEIKNQNEKITLNETKTDRILSESTRKISAIYPLDNVNPLNTYPGYRGPNQLVIYTRDFGRNTGTNEFGKEAVVIDGIVVRLTGANSNIPRNGFIVSGHGSAKKWISDNLKIGTKVEIIDRTIKAYTTIDSYRYYAKEKIKQVEDILISTKQDYDDRDDKFIYYYLKKAKQQYKKSLKDTSDTSLACAKESIQNASLAFRYTLPYVKNEVKGVWIRPTEHSLTEIQNTLNKIKDSGINNIFLETYYHGRTIFPSRVMEEYGFEVQNPEFNNFDVLAVWIKEAHKRQIKVHTWFESFYVGNKSPESNPKSILAVKPQWMNRTRQKADYLGYVPHPQEHNGYFLDPANPEVIEFLLKLINEMASRYNIDGVNIDYVRYPNISKENYSNQWGYTQYAREEFYSLYEIDPVEIKPHTSMWNNWCDYRRNKITNYVHKVSLLLRDRKIALSAVIFPDYKVSLTTKFQDWEYWTSQRYLSAVTPLILTSDDDLAKSMLEEIKKKSANDAYVFPGLFAGFIESDSEDLLKQIHIVRKLKLNGIILFDWAHLTQNYLDVLKTSAFREQTY